MINFDYIETFKTIVEEGGFRAASEKLNRAQSAISYAVKKLETDLGFQLFDRSKYSSNLTPQGKSFYQKSKGVFQSMKDLDTFAKGLKIGCEPHVRIAFSALLPLSPFLQGLEQLRWRFPQIDIKLIIDVLGADLLLLNDQVDIAISDVAGDPNEVESLLIGKVLLFAVTGKKNPLAKMQTPDLSIQPQITVRSGPLAESRSAGVLNPANTWSVSDFSSKKELIMHGMGWGYMPAHLIENELNKGSIIQIIKEPYAVSMYLSHLKAKPKGPGIEFLWDFLKQLKNRPWS